MLQGVEFLLQLVEFGFHVVVVVGGEGVDKDGVDERHADDAAAEEQQAEVGTHDVQPHGGHAARYGIGYLVPAFDGEHLEHGVDAVQGGGEVFRRRLAEEGAVEHGDDHDDDEIAEQEGCRLPQGEAEAHPDLFEVREAPCGAEQLEDAQGAEGDDEAVVGQGGGEVGQQCRQGDDGHHAVKHVPSVAPIALDAIGEMFQNHFDDKEHCAGDVCHVEQRGLQPAFLQEDDCHVEQHHEQHGFVVEEQFFHVLLFDFFSVEGGRGHFVVLVDELEGEEGGGAVEEEAEEDAVAFPEVEVHQPGFGNPGEGALVVDAHVGLAAPGGGGEEVHVFVGPRVGDEGDDAAVVPLGDVQSRLLLHLAQHALVGALVGFALATHANPLAVAGVVLFLDAVQHEVAVAVVNVAEGCLFHNTKKARRVGLFSLILL